MTREEEIKEKSKEYLPDGIWDDYTYKVEFVFGFKQGAKWANKTIIEKACEWIKENIDTYAKIVINPKSHYPEIVMCDSFEKSFKKAMEE